SEDMFRHRANGKHSNRSKFSDIKGDTLDHDDQNRLRLREKEGSTIKIRKLNPEIPDAKPHVSFGKRSEKPSLRVQEAPGSNKTKELKPLLRLKFKNPYADNQTSLAQSGEHDGSSIKGQRSKRKRPSPLLGDPSFVEDYEGADCSSDEELEDIMDANWIIQKLGKDAIGKKVEIHQRSNRTWHKGTVHEVFEGTSVVSVTLDDGKTSNVDLGKQGIRFYSQKRRWIGEAQTLLGMTERWKDSEKQKAIRLCSHFFLSFSHNGSLTVVLGKQSNRKRTTLVSFLSRCSFNPGVMGFTSSLLVVGPAGVASRRSVNLLNIRF
ncbi:hypothetical protein Tco_1242445, partial [Tanacetum coccineum]